MTGEHNLKNPTSLKWDFLYNNHYIRILIYCNFSTGDKRRAKVSASPSLIRSGMINGITHQERTIARPTGPFEPA